MISLMIFPARRNDIAMILQPRSNEKLPQAIIILPELNDIVNEIPLANLMIYLSFQLWALYTWAYWAMPYFYH